ncbi:MAG: LicD family protein [Bacteroidales bacterium]|nr:LicD family protein [Bacteroidales bacterium]
MPNALSGTLIPLDEVKDLLLSLISNLDTFCRERGIRYSLAYGSLIGAVRHQGFIPWDDDIDIYMPRPDYLRLIQEYNHPYYEIRCQDNDPEYPLLFAKLSDTRTCSIDKFGNSSPIAIDIFILDGMGATLSEAKANIRKAKCLQRIWSNQLFTAKIPLSRENGLLKDIYIILGKIFSRFISIESLVKKMNAFKCSHPVDGSKYCSILEGPFAVYETEKMLLFEDASFEGLVIRIPVHYDYLLKKDYGDYMQLPPENERVVTHEANAYWV